MYLKVRQKLDFVGSVNIFVVSLENGEVLANDSC